MYFRSNIDNHNIQHQSHNKTRAFAFMPCLKMFILGVIYEHVQYLCFQKVCKTLCRMGMGFWLQTDDVFWYNSRDVTFSNIIASDSNKLSRIHKTEFTLPVSYRSYLECFIELRTTPLLLEMVKYWEICIRGRLYLFKRIKEQWIIPQRAVHYAVQCHQNKTV